MTTYGLLINTHWCSGCRSCEIACRNEHGYPIGQDGIKVTEVGPFAVDKSEIPSGIDWTYAPQLTKLCDLCAERTARGEVPSCQLHCLAGVIEYGPVDELAKKLGEMSDTAELLVP